MNRYIKFACLFVIIFGRALTAIAQDAAITEPKLHSLVIPEYPQAARDADIGGDVSVLLLVDKRGKAKVVDSYGPFAPCSDLEDPLAGAVRAAAQTAAAATTFEAASFKGKPMERGILIRYHFDPQKSVAALGGDRDFGEGIVLMGKAVHIAEPKYPDGASGNTLTSGGVVVAVRVNEKGLVTHAGIVSGHKVFRRSSLDAACRSTFQPAMVGDRAMPMTGLIRFEYSIRIRPS
jgi:TonB family protein